MLKEMIINFIYSILMIILSIIIFFVYFKIKNRKLEKLISDIPGPQPNYPFFGNLDLFRIKGQPLNQSVYWVVMNFANQNNKEGIFRVDMLVKSFIAVFKPSYCEMIFKSKTNINKQNEYRFFEDFVGKSLFTSSGDSWRSRLKLLAPAFNSRILDKFLPIINENSNVLVEKFSNLSNENFIDIKDFILQCTFDIICETAMGVSIGAQFGKNEKYFDSTHVVFENTMKRFFSPWLWPDIIYKSISITWNRRQRLEILHSMTRNIIKERKSHLISMKNENNGKNLNQLNGKNLNQLNDKNNSFESKERKNLAFLDLLLEYHINDNTLTLEEIREEVDLYMFAGHHTVAISLYWTLYLLGRHSEVQNLIEEEQKLIFGDQTDRDITSEDLMKMEYLECVIKESLRIFPSAPLIGRNIDEDIKLGKYVLPKGSSVFILIEKLHSDPEVYPNPFDFKPERFQKRTDSKINAYNYVPFSAGLRSCVGKKFAIMVEKIVLTKILRKFKLRSLDSRDQISCAVDPNYRALSPIRIKFLRK